MVLLKNILKVLNEMTDYTYYKLYKDIESLIPILSDDDLFKLLRNGSGLRISKLAWKELRKRGRIKV